MHATIDISLDEHEPVLDIAPDGIGDEYSIDLGSVQLVINHAQMQSLYLQVRQWFEEPPASTAIPRKGR